MDTETRHYVWDGYRYESTGHTHDAREVGLILRQAGFKAAKFQSSSMIRGIRRCVSPGYEARTVEIRGGRKGPSQYEKTSRIWVDLHGDTNTAENRVKMFETLKAAFGECVKDLGNYVTVGNSQVKLTGKAD